MDPVFLTKEQILVCHQEQLELYGGLAGELENGRLDVALMAPQNVYCYQDGADIFDVAASYLRALAQAHAFFDGNKRIAAQAAILFLETNGWDVEMESPHLVLLVLKLLDRSISEEFVAEFFFGACCRTPEKLFSEDILSIEPPAAYHEARTSEERHAIAVDAVTAAFRVRLMDVCSRRMIRPGRFDQALDSTEKVHFQQVELKWRLQFGMGQKP